MGTIDFLGGAGVALRWLLAGNWNFDSVGAAFLVIAGGMFCLSGLGLIYAFIKDVRPGRLKITVGPIKLEYEDRLPQLEGDRQT